MTQTGVFLRLFQCLLLVSMLAGCSVYESDGRKYLETDGIGLYERTKTFNFSGCNTNPSTRAWVRFEKDSRADVSVSDDNSFDMKVVPSGETQYACYFHFTSAQEM